MSKNKVVHREKYKGYSIEVIKDNNPRQPYKAIALGSGLDKRDDSIEDAIGLLKPLIDFSIDMNKTNRG